jgi:hypothetical protein
MNSLKITEITICLHCGCSRDVVAKQMSLLKPLEEKYKVYWNNRIDRFPHAYPSYSQLINHSIATSPTEFIVLLNDRTIPTVAEVEKIINHLETGFCCSFIYNVGFMGFSKELVRTIGWWDERFLNGGWEDRDWVYRIKMADLALYESLEGTYETHWKSPLQIADCCARSTPFWNAKYDQGPKRDDWDSGSGPVIYKKIKEETYTDWSNTLGDSRPDIKNTWKKWNNSTLNIRYAGTEKPNGGPSASGMIGSRAIIEKYE